jgi:pentatricopeptide repeat protein
MEKTIQPAITTRLSRLPARPPAISHLIRTATSIDHVKQLHAQLIKDSDLNHHLTSPPFLSSLLSLSLSSSSLRYCLSFFLSSPDPSRLITCALRSVEPDATILAYSQFRCSCVELDEFALSVILQAIGKDKTGVGDFNVLNEAHGFVIKMRFDLDSFVQTALVRSYAAVGSVTDARKVFDRMLYRDLVAWSVMMDG